MKKVLTKKQMLSIRGGQWWQCVIFTPDSLSAPVGPDDPPQGLTVLVEGASLQIVLDRLFAQYPNATQINCTPY